MKLTVSNEVNNLIISVDISESMTFLDFKAYLEAESDIPPPDQIVIHNSKSLRGDGLTLEELGLKDDDLLVLQKGGGDTITSATSGVSAATGASGASGASADSAVVHQQIEAMRQQFLDNPQMANLLLQSNPNMQQLLHNPEAFKQVMKESLQQFQVGQNPFGPAATGGLNPQQQAELSRLEQDPDNPESQARILELIRQDQINKNMELAYDITPESFTSVSMLYIKIKVNNQPVQAFVDSGAQQTIISPRLAEKVGIDRLIDRRFVGEARGVGSTQILGKIHSVPISIGESEIQIPCSFMVIDTQVDLLFGLDMLKRHKCVIDLAGNKLVVGSNVETHFLPDNEIENNDLLGATVGNKGNSLGGNIFSDAPILNGGSDTKKKPASSAAADAAAKRQNVGQSKSKYNDEDIQRLMGLGFSRDQVVKALDACQGNVDFAASYLFQ